MSARPASRRPLLLVAMAVVVIGSVLLLWWAGWLPEADQLLAAVDWLRDAGWLGALAFIVGHAVAILTFIPITPLVFVAGFIWGPIGGTVVMSIGSLLGTTLALLLGRWLLRDDVAARYGHSAHFQAVDRAIARGGFRAVFLLRSAPIPLAVLNYTLSLTGIGLGRYAPATVLGLLPLTILYTAAGGGLAEASAIFEGRVAVGDGALWLFWAGVLAMVAVFAWIAAMARRELRRLMAEDAQPTPTPANAQTRLDPDR